MSCNIIISSLILGLQMACTYTRCKILLYMHLPASIRAFYLDNTVTRDVVCITIHSNDTSANKHCMLYNGTPLNINQHTRQKKNDRI